VLQKAVQKLRCVLTFELLRLLIIVVLSATACSGMATPVSPEPATTPTESLPALEETAPTDVETDTKTEHSQTGDALHSQRAPNNDIKFERISIEQGLSQSSVLCILQDSKGFMWFGTEDGLNRYDGYSFRVHKHVPEDLNSLSNNIVRSIYEDQSGALWIGTDGGLNKFDRKNGQFIRYQNDPNDPHSLSDNYVTSIYEDQSGMLWIGTDGGLNKFDRENGQFIRYQNDPNDPHSLSDNYVTSIYEDRAGVIWIGTHGGGFSRFDRETEHFSHYQFSYYQNDPHDPNSLSHHTVSSIREDQAGVLWIGTWGGGLNKFDRETEEFVHYQADPNDPHSLSDDDIFSIHENQAGGLWIGTGGGLDKLDRETDQFIHHQNDPNDPHSLSDNVVWSIYEDQAGVLWIGTYGGLNKFDQERKKLVHYQATPNDAHGLSDNYVTSIYEDRAGVIWIGTHSGGLNRFDRKNGQFIHYQNNPNDPYSLSYGEIRSIYEDQAGVIWIGTDGGLNKFDRKNGQSIRYQADPDDPHSLSGNDIFSIHEDQAGGLWIGTGGGLDKLDRETEQFIHYQNDPNDPHSLGHNYVFSIYEDRAGGLWIATYGGGLDKFDRETKQFSHYRNNPIDPRSLSNNKVLSVCEDQAGVLWIGTHGGLNKFDRATETFTHYREKDGLPNDVIHGILEDNQGYLWLSTNKGLSKFDPRTETFRNYDTRDGVQSNEFSGGACHKSSSGEMFFGGINGFNAFYPESVSAKDNPYIPPVVLVSLTQSGEDVDTGQAVESVQEVTFHWPNNFFEFEFAALSYSQPDKNQYAYMLEEFEEDWNYIGTRRFGRYTNLPGGMYTLRMKGSNNDGVWNKEGVSVTITIVPPFWETWWFRGIVALVLVGSVIGGYRLRVKSVELRNRELETLVEERTHALKERTHEIERRRQELEALYRADAELHRHLRLDQVLQALVDIAVDILQADKSSLMVWDDQEERLVVQVARGFRPETLAQMSFAPGKGTVGHVAATGEPVIVEDARIDSRVAKRLTIIEPEGIRSFMQVPITVGGEVFGVFSADYIHPRAFGDDERRLFMALAQRAALAIDTAQLYEQTQELAVMQERSRLARDLHDAVTQTLFSASLIAEALPTLWESDQDEGRQLLAEMRRLSRGALAEMRTLLLELRPAALVEASLGDLLRRLAESVTGRTGVPVTVTVEGQCALPSDVHVALYRVAQEALNNVVKHAAASQVTVSLRCTLPRGEDRQGDVELCISDDGRGFDPTYVSPDHLGLGIMRERAQAVGATLKVASQPDHGTQIVVVWKEG